MSVESAPEHHDLPNGYFESRDLGDLTESQLVDVIIWQQHGLEVVGQRLEGVQRMVDRLSVDPTTEMLTMGALGILADVLSEGQMLNILKERGFTLSLCFVDVNQLKAHNSIGGYSAGNDVLADVARRLKRLFRRRSDVVVRGLLQLLREASEFDVEDGDWFDALGRFDRGDEMIVVRFLPPAVDGLRRPLKLDKEVERIASGFDNATIIYDALPGLSEEVLNRVDPDNRFEVVGGRVVAPVSVTFAHLQAPMPVSRSQMLSMTRRAGEAVLNIKNARHGHPPGTVGVAIDASEEDLN